MLIEEERCLVLVCRRGQCIFQLIVADALGLQDFKKVRVNLLNLLEGPLVSPRVAMHD